MNTEPAELAKTLRFLATGAEIERVDSIVTALRLILDKTTTDKSAALFSLSDPQLRLTLSTIAYSADPLPAFAAAEIALRDYETMSVRDAVFRAINGVLDVVPPTTSALWFRDLIDSNRVLIYVRGTDKYAESAILRLLCVLGIEILTRLT